MSDGDVGLLRSTAYSPPVVETNSVDPEMRPCNAPAGRVSVGKFKAIVIEKADGGQKVALTEFDDANLMEGDVTVRVEWSTLNYKDGLAITGKAPVVDRKSVV